MIGKWLKGYYLRFSESRILIDELFRKRSSSKEGVRLSEGEFYSSFDFEISDLKELKNLYKERDFASASDELLRYYRSKKSFFLIKERNSDLIKRIKEQPYSFRSIMEKAEHICRHTISLPTGHTAEFGTFINWFSDFNGKSWMFLHISDFIKKLSDKALMKQYDINNLPISMEFNKHAHLIDLGRAYFMTGDEKYTQEFVIQLEDWIERNPVNCGISWVDAMTCSQRVISWLFSLSMFINSTYLRGENFYLIMRSLLLHGAYLAEALNDKNLRPSRMIACACALYLFTLTFPEFECSAHWKSKALRLLESEASAQFLPDGVYRERSIGMQMLLTEFLMLSIIADNLSGQKSSPSVLSAAERSLEFMMFSLLPSGKPIVFGDMPITHAWRFSIMAHDDFKNLLSIGSLLFNRGDMKFAGENFYEDILWFFGDEGEKKYSSILKQSPSSVAMAFADGGYFHFKDSWNKDATSCFFIANSKKRFPSMEKGIDGLIPHRDIMNFILTIRGEPFIIETGAYKGKKNFAPYFPSTAAHNSLMIDGREQSQVKNVKGNKKYMHLLKTRWLFSDDFDYLMAGNAGFEELKSMAIHRRELLYLKQKKWFLIKDTLEGTEDYNITHTFHFAPELDIILRGDYGCLIRGRREFMRLNPYYPGEFFCKSARGRLEPLAGWQAKDFNRVEPCQRLEYVSSIKLPAEIYIWISWTRGEFKVPPKEEIEGYFAKIGKAGGFREEEVAFEISEK